MELGKIDEIPKLEDGNKNLDIYKNKSIVFDRSVLPTYIYKTSDITLFFIIK